MGCCISVPHSTQVAPSKKTAAKNNNNLNQTDASAENQIHHHCQDMFPIPKQIMSGVSHIPRPTETDFIVCLTEKSFPLQICSTTLDDRDPCHTILPLVGISIHENGRVAAFGSIEILTECKQENAEYLAFLENLISFISGPRPSSPVIYLLDLDPGDANLLIHNISGLGFHAESGKNADNLSKYACVITIGCTKHGEKLYEYIVNGGGVIVCSSFDWQKFIPLLPFPFISPTTISFPQNPTSLSRPSTGNSLARQQSTSNLISSSNHENLINLIPNQSMEQILEYKQQQQQLILMDYINKYNHRANIWLSRCGLGISNAHIIFPVIPKATMKVITKSYDLEQTTFPFIVDIYKAIIQSDNIDIPEFSSVVNYLRYNILSINRNKNDFLTDILDVSMEFLQSTNYEQPEGLFYSVVHEIVAILLCDVINNIDPHEFESRMFNANLFPGEFEPSQDLLQEVEITVSLKSNEWHSTGLWLPARSISRVTITSISNNKPPINENLRPNSPNLQNEAINDENNENLLNRYFEDLYIQVGSQSESLLVSPGPWKRWPNVVLTYPIVGNSFEISSPFGGLIYIDDTYIQPSGHASQDLTVINVNEAPTVDFKPQNGRPRKITFKFSNVVHCPFYSNLDTWNETKDSQAPWAEFTTKYSIITLPSDTLKKVHNIESNIKIIDSIIKEILNFSCYTLTRKFRLVFDIDAPKSGSTSSYPLMLSYDILESFINMDVPSSDIFTMILKISIVTIPENALHPIVEAGFGTLIATHTLLRIYPTKVKSPYDFIYGHMTPIFNELWEIYVRSDKKLFQTVFGRFQNYCKNETFVLNEEAVKFIVGEMESITEKKFPKFLEEALNPDSNGEQQFPEYVFIEEEEIGE